MNGGKITMENNIIPCKNCICFPVCLNYYDNNSIGYYDMFTKLLQQCTLLPLYIYGEQYNQGSKYSMTKIFENYNTINKIFKIYKGTKNENRK